MYFFESPSKDPYFNLALEEYFFENLSPEKELFMLWQNLDSVVIGKYQNTAEEIDQAYVDAHKVRVARRLSGGGAVYHDLGNLNYTLIIHQSDMENFDFQHFARPVIRVLEGFGVRAEFNGRNDILIDGKKISGSSQFSSGSRLLHHGCILLDSNLGILSSVLKPRSAKFSSKSVKSVSSRVTTINEHATPPIAMADFKRALTRELLSGAEVENYCLPEEALQAVWKLRETKYATWEWNYGYCGDYEISNENRFSAGTISVKMNVQEGHIQDVRLFGDFFGSGDIRELEKRLVGLPLDSHLGAVLSGLDLSFYINGITAEDLASLLRG